MNKLALGIILIMSLSNHSVFSQDISETKDFEIIVPECRIHNSAYHTIDFMDARADKTNLGIVQLGAFNHQA